MKELLLFIFNISIFTGPFRHDNEIVPTSSTMIVDPTDSSRPVVNFDPSNSEEDGFSAKRVKTNEDEVILDENGDVMDIIKKEEKEIKQEPNLNPVVKLHKLPQNWTEQRQADLERQSNLAPSTVSVYPAPVSTVWRSQEFRDRFGMIQTRRSISTGAASTSTGARPKTFIPKKRIVYDVDRNGR